MGQVLCNLRPTSGHADQSVRPVCPRCWGHNQKRVGANTASGSVATHTISAGSACEVIHMQRASAWSDLLCFCFSSLTAHISDSRHDPNYLICCRFRVLPSHVEGADHENADCTRRAPLSNWFQVHAKP